MTSVIDELRHIYEKATVVRTGEFYTTVNAFTDQVEPVSPSLLRGIAKLIVKSTDLPFNVVVGEEDKGAHIATAVSLEANVPLTLARIYPYAQSHLHPGSVAVKLYSEYQHGTLIVNGLHKHHKVLIVEDTISTGGTIIALIKAINSRGAQVVRCVAVVEKIGPEGVLRVAEQIGVQVETFLRIQASERGVSVE